MHGAWRAQKGGVPSHGTIGHRGRWCISRRRLELFFFVFMFLFLFFLSVFSDLGLGLRQG